jgi:hypothetical protein
MGAGAIGVPAFERADMEMNFGATNQYDNSKHSQGMVQAVRIGLHWPSRHGMSGILRRGSAA